MGADFAEASFYRLTGQDVRITYQLNREATFVDAALVTLTLLLPRVSLEGASCRQRELLATLTKLSG